MVPTSPLTYSLTTRRLHSSAETGKLCCVWFGMDDDGAVSLSHREFSLVFSGSVQFGIVSY